MNAPLNPPANPLAKALWYIENNFAGALLLDEIANVAGVSRYHVSRAFGEASGRPITGYVRVPANRYAVFHALRPYLCDPQHVVDDLEQVAAEVRASDCGCADFKRYDARFDPRSGNGEVAIWVPLEG